MLSSAAYTLPRWASALRPHAPTHRLRMGHFPTPVFSFSPPGLPPHVQLYIKRDDFSGLEMSGNKMRKLEFIFHDVLAQQADCIVTCGGIQSNHCRATAVAARMLGLDSFLLLRTNEPDEDPGIVGNVLFDRLVGAEIIQMSRQEYGRYGSDVMIERTCERLRASGRRPYAIPVGGSNALGTWGYLQAIEEIHSQLEELQLSITDIAFACGSGGTAAGLGLGSYLFASHHRDHGSTPALQLDYSAPSRLPVHAYIVCDKDEYFFNYIDQKIFPGMGVDAAQMSSRSMLQITNAQGTGYARSTTEELRFIADVARHTGVVLDPVYSGKALFHLVKELQSQPERFVGRSILFVHTGGQFGVYDKARQLDFLCDETPVQRFRMEN
ncbi:hypothetical protein P43SY_004273 [Pythium insidiosum]|uniref:Tryptophan synthase beta chain-like PALP domain-containing protein n=1 Tax=Pythium insidiosum TaxID=114742 RepID=A0AAD5Q3X2_PYTIN|nr:hypothetical protein P43SY_004273 [Pythium insidiosum]